MAALAPKFTLAPYDYAEARALERELGLAEPVAVALVRRGHRTPAEARAFLEASEEHDPFAFDAMEEVVERVRAAIPSRLEDGYGLTLGSVEQLRGRGTDLLITVDCGIGSAEEVAAARERGIEVI